MTEFQPDEKSEGFNDDHPFFLLAAWSAFRKFIDSIGRVENLSLDEQIIAANMDQQIHNN